MIKIETLQGELLSMICREVSPIRHESIQIKNKLLDGSFHLQTIGEPIRYIDFVVIANQSQAEQINLIETKGEPIKLTEYDRVFIGTLDKAIEWSRVTTGYENRNKRVYMANATIVVSQEGDV